MSTTQWQSCRFPSRRPLVRFRFVDYIFRFDWQQLKGVVNSKCVPNVLSSNNNLAQIKIVLGCICVLSQKISLHFGLSLFLKVISVILCWKPWQCLPVSGTHLFCSKLRSLMPQNYTFPQTFGNAINLRLFGQWFWDQNRNLKYWIPLKQSITKLDHEWYFNSMTVKLSMQRVILSGPKRYYSNNVKIIIYR